VELIRSKKMAGRAVLLAGPPGTGKVCKLKGVERVKMINIIVEMITMLKLYCSEGDQCI